MSVKLIRDINLEDGDEVVALHAKGSALYVLTKFGKLYLVNLEQMRP